jgi:uncharacterized protein (TIGR02001 family)
MKTISLAAVVLAASAGAAFAGDLPSSKSAPMAPVYVSPWDFDIGAGITNDYIFRGITQSNHNPSVAAHGELRYNWNSTYQWYVGVAGESIKLSPYTAGPSMELDVYGGARATYGAITLDIGAWGYLYPDTPRAYHPKADASWVEVYAKPSWAVNDSLTVGANFFYTPSYINTGAEGEYLSGTVKYVMPGSLSAFTVSGEYGYQWLGNVDGTTLAGAFVPFRSLPSYATWNAGISYTWKFATLDLRYVGTSLSQRDAWRLTGIDTNNAGWASQKSNYGDDRFVATLSFALGGKDLK